jgi:hypothetical protein
MLRMVDIWLTCEQVDTSGETKDSYVKLEGALRERDEWAALKQSPHSPETSPSP